MSSGMGRPGRSVNVYGVYNHITTVVKKKIDIVKDF